jgi:hypothetical protein
MYYNGTTTVEYKLGEYGTTEDTDLLIQKVQKKGDLKTPKVIGNQGYYFDKFPDKSLPLIGKLILEAQYFKVDAWFIDRDGNPYPEDHKVDLFFAENRIVPFVAVKMEHMTTHDIRLDYINISTSTISNFNEMFKTFPCHIWVGNM